MKLTDVERKILKVIDHRPLSTYDVALLINMPSELCFERVEEMARKRYLRGLPKGAELTADSPLVMRFWGFWKAYPVTR